MLYGNHTLCMLHETHSGENTHTSWKQEWGNDAYWSELNKYSKGLRMLIIQQFHTQFKNTQI